mmetsp:Transcript_2520/g.4346  ORF Transcript_2520/g.4346 Transcript_2520/m.4346 type:complete len:114 (+) Transcript_2520:816-1157(+)
MGFRYVWENGLYCTRRCLGSSMMWSGYLVDGFEVAKEIAFHAESERANVTSVRSSTEVDCGDVDFHISTLAKWSTTVRAGQATDPHRTRGLAVSLVHVHEETIRTQGQVRVFE